MSLLATSILSMTSSTFQGKCDSQKKYKTILFSTFTVVFERASNQSLPLLPSQKTENFCLVTLELICPNKLDLGIPALKPQELLTERNGRERRRQSVLMPWDNDTFINPNYTVYMKAILATKLNKLISATHNMTMLLD